MKTFDQFTASEKAWYRVATTTNEVDFHLNRALAHLAQLNLQTKLAGGTSIYSEDEDGLIQYLNDVKASSNRLQKPTELPHSAKY